MIEESKWFDTIVRTKIGSPHVVAALNEIAIGPAAGFEANGGFLLQHDIKFDFGTLNNLPTRDAILPIIACLALTKVENKPLSEIINALPARFMRADRVKNVPSERAQAFLSAITNSQEFRSEFDIRLAHPTKISNLDGVHLTISEGDTVHFRQSGNAPETRIYVETGSYDRTERLITELHEKLTKRFAP